MLAKYFITNLSVVDIVVAGIPILNKYKSMVVPLTKVFGVDILLAKNVSVPDISII